MSVQHSNAATQAGFAPLPMAVMLRQDLKPLDKLVYGFLKHLAWRNHGDEAEPPLTEIMRVLGVTENTARASLRRLSNAPCLEGDEREGAPKLLAVKRRGLGLPNRYFVNEPYLENDGSVPAKSADQTLENRGSLLSRQDVEPKTKSKPPAPSTATVIEHLGGRRWKIASSREGKGPWTVDLDRMRCNCPASVKECRHITAALRAERDAVERVEQARQRALREAVWNTLAEIYGEPADSKQRRAGRAVVQNDIIGMLRAEGVEETPEHWAEEVRARYAALAREWTKKGMLTPNALAEHWGMAGKLMHGGSATVEQESEEDRRLRERYTRA